MSRILTSPVPEFPGTITLPDHLCLEQVLAYEDGINTAKAYADGGGESLTKINSFYLPIFESCITERSIVGWDDKFPMTPRLASAKLANWLMTEINKMYAGETEIPNEPGPEPTPTPAEPTMTAPATVAR
jgi:hypothetical protein